MVHHRYLCSLKRRVKYQVTVVSTVVTRVTRHAPSVSVSLLEVFITLTMHVVYPGRHSSYRNTIFILQCRGEYKSPLLQCALPMFESRHQEVHV